VRGQLIAAARDLFLKYGYRAVSSRQVAAAAGANPAMIHYYFGNKHGLYKAMLEQAIGPGVARLNAMLEAPPEEASVARMLDTYMHILEANPWIPGLLLREVLMPDGAFRDQFIRDFGSRFAPRVAELVRHETLSGHLRKDLDPRLAVVSFLSLGLFPFIAMPVWTRALDVRSRNSSSSSSSRTRCGSSVKEFVHDRPQDRLDRRDPRSAPPRRLRARFGARDARDARARPARADRTGAGGDQDHARARGARVAQGDTLVELDSTAIDAQLAQARARASEARARLAELEHGPRAEQIAAARAQLAEDEARVVVETKEYDRQLDLVKRKLVSQSNVDRQRAARDGAIAARRRSAAQLEELETGTRSEQVDQARENVASSDAAVQSLEIDAARLVIRAPRKGFIDALPYKLGERPPQGAPVVVMLADDAPYARVYLPEPLFSQMHVGDDVSVQIDGADHAYAGRVRFLSAQAAFTPYYALTQRIARV
jgi:HlyD family secretion protein